MTGDTRWDRVALFCARAAAAVTLMAGLALFTAAMPLVSLLGQSDVARTLSRLGVQVGTALVVCGGLSIWLARPHGVSLPVSRHVARGGEPRQAESTPSAGGWLGGIAVTLVSAPVWVAVRMQPLVAEWRSLLPLLADTRMWDGANTNGAGVVLLPIFAALTPPLLEVLSLIAMCTASVVLLTLLWRRSVAFPRLYAIVVVLLLGWVIATHRSATGALLAAEEVRRLMEGSSRPQELAVALSVLSRYTSVVATGAGSLPWACLGYAVWVPSIIGSSWSRAAFSATANRNSARLDATTVDAITKPPRFPG